MFISMTDSPDEMTPRLDAADRLERVIDAQSATLERIDTKTERIARLLGILLGLVLSSLSLGVQLAGVAMASLSLPARVSFLVGIGFLLLALAGAIITLLSSRYEIGLGHGAGALLSQSGYKVSMETHLRRVLGTYAESVKVNYRIIEVNARRLRRTLISFLIGLLYLTVSAVFILTGIPETVEWSLVGLTIPLASGLGWVILSRRYLPLGKETIHHE